MFHSRFDWKDRTECPVWPYHLWIIYIFYVAPPTQSNLQLIQWSFNWWHPPELFPPFKMDPINYWLNTDRLIVNQSFHLHDNSKHPRFGEHDNQFLFRDWFSYLIERTSVGVSIQLVIDMIFKLILRFLRYFLCSFSLLYRLKILLYRIDYWMISTAIQKQMLVFIGL